MITEIPEGLFKVLKGVVDENIEEYDIQLSNNQMGQGYVAEIHFLTLIHRKTQEKQELIVKEEKKASKETEEEFKIIIQNEMVFYTSIWPFLQKYFKNSSGKNLNILPKCFGTSSTGPNRIIMKNIVSEGYVLYDKTKQLDDDHFKIIFETYGLYHGVSMALREQDSGQYNLLVNMLTNYIKKIYNEDDHPVSKSFLGRIPEAQEYFDPVKENHILEKLRMYEKSGIQLLRRCVNDGFPKGVILHGDCWSNNMMFKYNEHGKPYNIKLLDFQAVCHGSPVLDLSYCLYSGATEETLTKLDDYLRIYHHSLSDTLREFDLSAENIYSFETLKEEWKQFCKYGFPLGLYVMKMKLVNNLDLTEGLNFEVELPEGLKDRYKKQVRYLVYHFYNNDFF